MSVLGVILVHIFPHSEFSIFSPNAGKCRPEQLQIRTLFTEWILLQLMTVYNNSNNSANTIHDSIYSVNNLFNWILDFFLRLISYWKIWMFSDENHFALNYVDVLEDYCKQNVLVCLLRHHRSYKKYQPIALNVFAMFIFATQVNNMYLLCIYVYPRSYPQKRRQRIYKGSS